jgi:hypothetical protein
MSQEVITIFGYVNILSSQRTHNIQILLRYICRILVSKFRVHTMLVSAGLKQYLMCNVFMCLLWSPSNKSLYAYLQVCFSYSSETEKCTDIIQKNNLKIFAHFFPFCYHKFQYSKLSGAGVTSTTGSCAPHLFITDCGKLKRVFLAGLQRNKFHDKFHKIPSSGFWTWNVQKKDTETR